MCVITYIKYLKLDLTLNPPPLDSTNIQYMVIWSPPCGWRPCWPPPYNHLYNYIYTTWPCTPHTPPPPTYHYIYNISIHIHSIHMVYLQYAYLPSCTPLHTQYNPALYNRALAFIYINILLFIYYLLYYYYLFIIYSSVQYVRNTQHTQQ